MKVILITGSTRGVGFCLAKYLKKNHKIIIHGSTDTSIEKAKQELDNTKNITYVISNLLENNYKQLIDFSIDYYGKLDILINNAGIAIQNDNSGRQITLNAIVPYELSKYAIEKGVEKIINVSSGSAVCYHELFTEYCLSKKMLEDMTKSLALQYYKKCIITCIRIDLTLKTDMTKNIFTKEEYEEFSDVDTVIPLFLYLLKGGDELSGKIYSLNRSRTNFIMEIQTNSNYVMKKHTKIPKDKTKFYCTGENTFNDDLGYYPSDDLVFQLENKIQDAIKDNNSRIETNNITIMHGGVSGCFENLCKIFINETDEVICHTVTFSYILSSVEARGGLIRYVRPDLVVDENRMEYYLDEILNKINSNTKMIYLVHPTYILCDTFIENKFEEFLSKIPTNIAIVLDECYVDYVNCFNSLKYINKYFVFSLRGFSKMYGLASTRLGYIVSNAKYKEILENSQTLKAVPEQTLECVLSNFEKIDELKKLFFAEKKYLTNKLNKLKIKFLGNGLFLVLFFKNQKLLELLREQDIFLFELNLFPDTIIYQIGTRDYNKKFINVLTKLL
jgi:histidinol-phosphate/aromatic aminotransferase/cobyric acid decarboxylase-like protein/short-subunit dehydrogenase involved in D-alanine esterification of teichoic acids